MSDISYKRCISCGNYFQINGQNKDDAYCSRHCNKEFTICMNCGNYFEIKEMVTKENLFCCKKCSIES